MNRKMLIPVLAFTASLCAPVFAQNTTLAATKPVKVQVRNETKNELKLRAGDEHVTVAPGTSAKMLVAVGGQIVADETNPTFSEGTVVTTVAPSMDGTTIAIR